MRKKILIAAGWLLLWQAAALLIHNSILMAGPLEAVRSLLSLLSSRDFLPSAAASFVRIEGGFLAGSAAGILLAFLAWRHPLVREIAAPAVSVLKAVPVASFVILLLIWAGSRNLSLFISMIVVFPVLYLNTLAGLSGVDRQLLEMAEVFRIPLPEKLRYIILPQIATHLRGAFALALGMSWKSGAAAEVIGQPLRSVGNGLYRAKVLLDTGSLIAWTVVIVFMSGAFEKLFLYLFDRFIKSGAAAESGHGV